MADIKEQMELRRRWPGTDKLDYSGYGSATVVNLQAMILLILKVGRFATIA